MRNSSRGVVAFAIGGVVGDVAAYLFFTDEGKALRRQFEPALDDFTRELSNFRSSIEKEPECHLSLGTSHTVHSD